MFRRELSVKTRAIMVAAGIVLSTAALTACGGDDDSSGGGGSASGNYCDAMKKLDSLDDVDNPDIVNELEKARAAAPDEIKGEWDTFVDEFNKMLDASKNLPSVDPDASPEEMQQQMEDMQNQLEDLGDGATENLEKAADKITSFTEDKCDLKLSE